MKYQGVLQNIRHVRYKLIFVGRVETEVSIECCTHNARQFAPNFVSPNQELDAWYIISSIPRIVA